MYKRVRFLFFVVLLALQILDSGCSRKIVGLQSLPWENKMHPKFEFRGAWVSIIWQNQYRSMNSTQLKDYYVRLLDSLKSCRMNAVIFQVRPSADALYPSDLEPWTKFLTGIQGKAPEGGFDPMRFVIEECHKRNMEFHAWLNPYRVTTSEDEKLSPSHIYYRHPDWFVKYGKQVYFDPGLPQSRDFICKVVKDIVSRYDVDAIHMDDYFYPYPIAGLPFPDDRSFSLYARSMGFSDNQRADWRRQNVNLLIEGIKKTIVSVKPWVRFGISPFGIYRNKRNTPDGSGSETNGLQDFDDLYADLKLWVKKGWIDYNIPQIYWEIGHPAADYETLVKWWSVNNSGSHLYIGQDVERTMKAGQLGRKMEIQRATPAVYGNCWWHGYDLLNNFGGINDSLRRSDNEYPALIPPYLHLSSRKPSEVRSLRAVWTARGYQLCWKGDNHPYSTRSAKFYVVYKFKKGERLNLSDPSKIAGISSQCCFTLPYADGKNAFTYVVTAIGYLDNESKGKLKNLKL